MWLARHLGAQNENDSLPLLVAHCNIVVYACAFWLCQPVFPFLVKELGASVITLGYLQTAFSLAQTLGALYFGRLSDALGPRIALILSQLGGALSYTLLSQASSVEVLFLSRAPSALQHCMMAAQATVSVFTSDATRTKSLGLLSLSYGIGMVTGSAAGGWLSKHFSNHMVALFAGLLSWLVMPITYVLLPSSSGSTKKKKEDASEGLLEAMRVVMRLPRVRKNLSMLLLVGVALSFQRSSFSMMSTGVFKLDASDLGYLMSMMALVSMLTNIAIGQLPFKDTNLLVGATAALAPLFMAYTFVSAFSSLLMVLIPIAVCSTTVYTLNTSILSKEARENSGLVIGLNHSLRSMLGIVSPTVVGYLLSVNASLIGYSGGVLCATSAFFLYLN